MRREKRWHAIGRVTVALDKRAGRVRKPSHIPVRVLQGKEPLVQGTVAGRVAIANQKVVNVTRAPNELALRRGMADAILDDLPLVRIVEVAGLAQDARRIALRDGAIAAAIVLISRDRLAAGRGGDRN